MTTLSKVLKWVTFGLLLSSVIMIFLPYRENSSLISLINLLNDYGDELSSSIKMNFYLSFLFPLILTFASAFLMLKVCIPTCVIATVLNLLATFCNFGAQSYYKELEIGWTLYFVIAILGIVLPILTIIFTKLANKKQVAVSEAVQ